MKNTRIWTSKKFKQYCNCGFGEIFSHILATSPKRWNWQWLDN